MDDDKEEPKSRKPEDDPDRRLSVDELIDEESMGSFPASDPPSHWAREPDPEEDV